MPEKSGLGIELDDEVVQKYLREPKYIYKAGYFEPTPEFDEPMTLEEAQNLVMTARIQLGWVDPEDLIVEEEVETEGEEGAETEEAGA